MPSTTVQSPETAAVKGRDVVIRECAGDPGLAAAALEALTTPRQPTAWDRALAVRQAAEAECEAGTTTDPVSGDEDTPYELVSALLDARDELNMTEAPHWQAVAFKVAELGYQLGCDPREPAGTAASDIGWECESLITSIYALGMLEGEKLPGEVHPKTATDLARRIEALARRMAEDVYANYAVNPLGLSRIVNAVTAIQEDGRTLAKAAHPMASGEAIQAAFFSDDPDPDAQFLEWEREVVMHHDAAYVGGTTEESSDRYLDLLNLIGTTPAQGPTGAMVKLRTMLREWREDCGSNIAVASPEDAYAPEAGGVDPTGKRVSLYGLSLAQALTALGSPPEPSFDPLGWLDKHCTGPNAGVTNDGALGQMGDGETAGMTPESRAEWDALSTEQQEAVKAAFGAWLERHTPAVAA